VVEKLGESVIWGPKQEVSLLRFENWTGEYVRIESGEEMVGEIDQQDGWITKEATFCGELVDLKSDSKVGYVASKLASQMSDDASAHSQVMPIRTEVTVLAEGEDAEADGICVYWNSVELHEGTDLVIAPMADTKMAKMFGILVDDRDEEKEKEMDEAAADDGKSHIYEDVDGALMDATAYDVDDAHDDELVTFCDKENPVIVVGKLFPNMGEFRMCFKTYAVKKEFDAKTMWIDRKKLYARCRGYDRGAKPWKYISARRQPDGSTIRVNKIPFEHTCITSSQRVSTMISQFWVAKKITHVLAKTPNTTAKKLKIDLEMDYPIKVNYTTVWKAKQRAMKELYGDWANTFRMLYSFKAEVEKRSPGSVVETAEVAKDGKVYFSKFFYGFKTLHR
jgi:hypothetical protein